MVIWDFTPALIKNDPKRFKRVISPTGKRNLGTSSHCQANLKADKEAFAALCKHTKAKDNVERTVIGFKLKMSQVFSGAIVIMVPKHKVVSIVLWPAKLGA